jgi:hypothetical protein
MYPEVMSACDALWDRGASSDLWLCRGNAICASDFVRNDPFGDAAPVTWFGQACAAQLDLDPKAVLSIMRYP